MSSKTRSRFVWDFQRSLVKFAVSYLNFKLFVFLQLFSLNSVLQFSFLFRVRTATGDGVVYEVCVVNPMPVDNRRFIGLLQRLHSSTGRHSRLRDDGLSKKRMISVASGTGRQISDQVALPSTMKTGSSVKTTYWPPDSQRLWRISGIPESCMPADTLRTWVWPISTTYRLHKIIMTPSGICASPNSSTFSVQRVDPISPVRWLLVSAPVRPRDCQIRRHFRTTSQTFVQRISK